MPSSCDMRSSPARCQTSSGVSTMNVDVSPSYWYACAWNQPCSVFSNANVNAGKRWCVPSQTKRHRRRSTSGLYVSAYFAAHAAVDAVAGDDDVGIEVARGALVVGDVVLVAKLDAERFAALLQDAQQPLAADAAEAVAARADRAPAEVDVDVVPAVERAGDLARRLRIRGFEVAERLVGEHDTPAERVVGAVALEHADRMTARRARFRSNARYRPAGPPPMISTRIGQHAFEERTTNRAILSAILFEYK